MTDSIYMSPVFIQSVEDLSGGTDWGTQASTRKTWTNTSELNASGREVETRLARSMQGLKDGSEGMHLARNLSSIARIAKGFRANATRSYRRKCGPEVEAIKTILGILIAGELIQTESEMNISVDIQPYEEPIGREDVDSSLAYILQHRARLDELMQSTPDTFRTHFTEQDKKSAWLLIPPSALSTWVKESLYPKFGSDDGKKRRGRRARHKELSRLVDAVRAAHISQESG